MLKALDKCSKVNDDRRGARVTIESDLPLDQSPIEELQTTETRNVALKWAAEQNLPNPAISSLGIFVYPVNKKGQSQDQVQHAAGAPVPADHPDMQPHRYRAEVDISCRL